MQPSIHILTAMKCDRAPQGCGRCESAGKPCWYVVPDSSLRVRNQTDKAERHAVSAWRARAKHAPIRYTFAGGEGSDSSDSTSGNVPSSTLERPLATKVEELARYRFIYDFSECRSGLSAMSFGDSRAASLVTSALSRALAGLGDSLRSPHFEVTHKLVLMAILLGLHQVRCLWPSALLITIAVRLMNWGLEY